ncbi:MAG: DUF6502 family protein [Acetobacteraceae bacterium]|nr:DUF6502 family protein [Acetobacteraceae bacterium]
MPPSSELLSRAVTVLLRPLVRLCIQAGLTFPAMNDLIRSLYVDVAVKDALPDPHSRTDSRVSLITGVHRKEIRRLREQPEPEAGSLGSLSLSSRVVAHWLATAAATDAGGRPLPLRRSGPAPSFEALVADVTTDVRPRALLDEWIAAGVATVDAEGWVRLEEAAFVPRGDRDQQMFFYARNMRDHLAAGSRNVSAAPDGPRFLDRAAHYDGLSPGAADEIEAAARSIAEKALLELNRTAMAIADRDDREAADGGLRAHRVTLGVFVFADAGTSP